MALEGHRTLLCAEVVDWLVLVACFRDIQDADLVPTAGSYPCAEDYGRVIPLRGRLREGDTLRNVLRRVAPHRIMVREGSTPSCAVTKVYDPDAATRQCTEGVRPLSHGHAWG